MVGHTHVGGTLTSWVRWRWLLGLPCREPDVSSTSTPPTSMRVVDRRCASNHGIIRQHKVMAMPRGTPARPSSACIDQAMGDPSLHASMPAQSDPSTDTGSHRRIPGPCPPILAWAVPVSAPRRRDQQPSKWCPAHTFNCQRDNYRAPHHEHLHRRFHAPQGEQRILPSCVAYD